MKKCRKYTDKSVYGKNGILLYPYYGYLRNIRLKQYIGSFEGKSTDKFLICTDKFLDNLI